MEFPHWFRAWSRKARCASSVMLIMIAASATQPAVAAAGAPSGAGVQPQEFSGNPSCQQFYPGSVELRAGSPTSQTYSDGALSVAVTTRATGKGQVFDWDQGESRVVIQGVFVKGGPGGNLYRYAESGLIVSSDTGLHSPVNPQNNKYFGLSHISFCYQPGAPSIAVTKSCQGNQAVSGDVVTQVNTVRVTNDGDFELSNISLKETIGSLSCSVNGGPSLPAGEEVAVLQSLAAGAHVDFTVTCTGAAVNITNEIVATGHSAMGPVSDTDANAPATECPFTPNPMVEIDKDCPSETDVRLKALDGKLVVEVCPTIRVTNLSQTQTLSSAKVTDALINLDNFEVGPLLPGASSVINDRCYYPTAPEQSELSAGSLLYKPTGSSFLNTATVNATGKFGGTASDQDSAGKGECDLCVCEGEACP